MDILFDLKSETQAQKNTSNNSIMLMNNNIEKRQNNDPLMKTMYPIYLYRPPFGYPRNINVVFLRELAKNPYVFSVIKAISDQASETKWEIKLKEDVTETKEILQAKKFIQEFFKNPNSDNESFSQLLRKIIPDILTIDSACFVKIYNIKKELLQLRVVDGGAILKNPDQFGSLSQRADIIPPNSYDDINLAEGYNRQDKAYKVALNQYNSYGYKEQAAYFQFAYAANFSVPIPYGKKEIIYMMENPTSETVYSRCSALQSAIDITLNLIYSSKASLDLFLNANIPTGIVQLAGAIKEDTDAFQSSLYNQQYSGFDEYGYQRKINGKIPIVGHPNVSFIPLNFKNNETQLLEIQQWFTKVLWSCFGVNASEMGFTSGDSRATDQSQQKTYAKKAVNPRLKMIAGYLNDQILPELPMGDLFEFCFDEYDIEEDKKKWELYKVQKEVLPGIEKQIAEKEGIKYEEPKKEEYFEEEDDNKESKTETKSVHKTPNNNIVVTGESLEDVLKQTTDKLQEEGLSEIKEEDSENFIDWIKDGSEEHNQEVNDVIEQTEVKSDKIVPPKKTVTENIFDSYYKEFVKEVDKIIKKNS